MYLGRIKYIPYTTQKNDTITNCGPEILILNLCIPRTRRDWSFRFIPSDNVKLHISTGLFRERTSSEVTGNLLHRLLALATVVSYRHNIPCSCHRAEHRHLSTTAEK